MSVTYPRIVACGDSALSIELSDEIDEDVNARVIALAADLTERPVDAITEMVPTYRSLLVLYDPSILRAQALRLQLEARLRAAVPGSRAARRFVVPVVYGGEAGLDLAALAEMKDLSVEELVAIHAAAEYRVYMIGFAPGFAYLGGLPEILHTPRLATPRQRIEAGSIGIGGRQASINSVPGPSGWRYIGRTPLRLFDPARSEPFLLGAGDRVRFRPIGPEEAAALDAAVAAGKTAVEPEPA
ncbi:5-oxoprolinase subunit PxpB [Rhizobium sp. TRM96647]|uniref:5-oxoprolinase subunit PxpB n=1 Tax=unclassified Rhizobium TaxID=2613769 RepID=UPI0021E918A6|nr:MULTISPECIES: 5-oxoprolinase subunit PxpB [unclassified Rhizobium]MCV3738792.1 5-oxoprolinase subunit PxpB [Rhizobium sp. TRM96647]MCV3760501.1 5-oxoprolinase subunit PxpB [Rhizobium sp. TRM96650]